MDTAAAIAQRYFYDHDTELIPTIDAVEYHTHTFMDSDYYKPEHFNNRNYGPSAEAVLLGQLDAYSRDMLGYIPAGEQ